MTTHPENRGAETASDAMTPEQLARFDAASNHPYECRCEICKEWWAQVPPEEDDCEEINGEPVCLVCGGEGIVEGSDHLDWDEDGYDDFIKCTSCHGSGLAKDMTWA